MPRFDTLDLTDALVNGAVTFAWYALPDAVPSRRVRGLAKALLTVPLVAVGVHQNRRLTAENRTVAAAAVEQATDPAAQEDPAATASDHRATVPTVPTMPDGVPADSLDLASLVPQDPAKRAVLLGATAAVAAGSIATTVAVERAIHRLGEHMAARGTRLPHTRIGLVSGALAFALTLATAHLPGPDTEPAGGPA